MSQIVAGGLELGNDSLTVIPLGGQSEIGQVLWVIAYKGSMLVVDAGAAYPAQDMPGVDLLFPNTTFLEENRDKILALLLTNAHEEHCGGVSYLLHHLPLPRIMGPKFVSAFLAQCAIGQNPEVGFPCPIVETVQPRSVYEIGPFEVEWIQVNDAVADACALKISTPEGSIVYTSSFKLDQTPVDNQLFDVNRLAQIGDEGVLLLIGDSAGVESAGYTPSEKHVMTGLTKHIRNAKGRVIVVLPGTNTHRLQILFDIASKTDRKVVLVGEALLRTAVSAAITGNLSYDRKLESSPSDLAQLSDSEVLAIATGLDGDPMQVLRELADGNNKDITLREGDTVIFSADVTPGRSRQMAMILDHFLSIGVSAVYGTREGVHVSKHASREELKLMLNMTQPKFFVPALGEGRHINNHGELAREFGLPEESIYKLRNGDVLEIERGHAAVIINVESPAVLFNRDQGERVTAFSVSERRALSTEGVITIGLVVNEGGVLISGPVIHAGAAGFLRAPEWETVRKELSTIILQTVTSNLRSHADPGALRGSVREAVSKALRAKLQAKPTVQVIVQEIATAQRKV